MGDAFKDAVSCFDVPFCYCFSTWGTYVADSMGKGEERGGSADCCSCWRCYVRLFCRLKSSFLFLYIVRWEKVLPTQTSGLTYLHPCFFVQRVLYSWNPSSHSRSLLNRMVLIDAPGFSFVSVENADQSTSEEFRVRPRDILLRSSKNKIDRLEYFYPQGTSIPAFTA